VQRAAFVEHATSCRLEGDLVVLRPLRAEDAEGWSRAASEDRSAYGYTKVPGTPDEASRAIRALLEERDRAEAVPYTTVARATGQVVGATRFLTLRWWLEGLYPDVVEIGGTWLAASAQRTGVNTEAKLLMLRHAFERWEVARVDLKTDARNERSRRAIERLGASFEGVLRGWQPSLVAGEEGRWRDSAIYSILPSEWPAVRDRLEVALGR